MHIKIVNTDSKYKCILMRGNDPGRVNRRKGYRVVNRLNCCDVLSGPDGVHPSSDRGCPKHFSPLLVRLILAIDRSPSIKLMVALGPEACSISTTTLSAVGATTTPWVGSQIYLLRCPAPISFSTRNFKLWQWFRGHGPYDNHTLGICGVGPRPPS